MRTLGSMDSAGAPRSLAQRALGLTCALALALTSVGARAQATEEGPAAQDPAAQDPAAQDPTAQDPAAAEAAPADVVDEAVESDAEQGEGGVVQAEETAQVEPVEPELTPQAAPPSKIPSYAMWGVGGASLVLGTVYGVLALQAKNDFNDNPTTKNADKAHDRAIVADVGLGLGVILGITGTIFYFVKDGDAKDTAKAAPARQRADLRVAPFVNRSATGGTLSVRF